MALPSHHCSVATVVRKHSPKTCKYKYVCNFIYITTVIFGGWACSSHQKYVKIKKWGKFLPL